MKQSILIIPLSILSICLCSCSPKSDYERFKGEFLNRYGNSGSSASYLPRNGYYSAYTFCVQDQTYFAEASFEGYLNFSQTEDADTPRSTEFRYLRREYETGKWSKETYVLFDGEKLSVSQTEITYGNTMSSSSSTRGRTDVTSCGLYMAVSDLNYNLYPFVAEHHLADETTANWPYDDFANYDYFHGDAIGTTLKMEEGVIFKNQRSQSTSIYEFDSNYQLDRVEIYTYVERATVSLLGKEYPAFRVQGFSKLEYIDSIDDVVPMDFAEEADIEVKNGLADELVTMILYKEYLQETQL